MVIVAIIPMIFIYIVVFGGIAVATNMASEAAEFITKHFSAIGIVAILFYIVAIIWEYKIVKKEHSHRINMVVFVFTNILRSAASFVYMLSVLYASAFTFTDMSVFDTLFLIVDLPLILLPMFAYFIYEGLLDFDPCNGIIIFGSILSTAGSLLGVLVLDLGGYVIPALQTLF